ncbi:MAG TPA: DUF167 domain-containing protein [Casimicrobiaceae bacterium]|nr:DUF167 domain-containing protein [Casimicrobiaceae bacterium]
MTTRISVRVKPNARVSALRDLGDGTWIADVKAPPVDGKANEELRALVAREFGVPKARVSIRHGVTGRAKLVEIAD